MSSREGANQVRSDCRPQGLSLEFISDMMQYTGIVSKNIICSVNKNKSPHFYKPWHWKIISNLLTKIKHIEGICSPGGPLPWMEMRRLLNQHKDDSELHLQRQLMWELCTQSPSGATELPEGETP